LLSDSNTDWGQQLKGTKRYLDQRGVKDCWFVYFAEGVADAHYYGIPCKPLPTADSLWTNEPMDVPAAIDGPVLISGSNMSGFEFGPGTLNPYEQFKTLKPTAVIQYGVFVFDGHFEIPLAASLTHSQKAGDLLAANNFPAALSEAEQAVALAPQDVRANSILGDVLVKLNRTSEARASYERALQLAKTIEPEFRTGWIDDLQKKLKDLPE
jgi:tetratricopeptide (TPR) repeat protein